MEFGRQRHLDVALDSDQISSDSLRAMPCSSTSSLRAARSSSSALDPPNLPRIRARKTWLSAELRFDNDSNFLHLLLH